MANSQSVSFHGQSYHNSPPKGFAASNGLLELVRFLVIALAISRAQRLVVAVSSSGESKAGVEDVCNSGNKLIVRSAAPYRIEPPKVKALFVQFLCVAKHHWHQLRGWLGGMGVPAMVEGSHIYPSLFGS